MEKIFIIIFILWLFIPVDKEATVFNEIDNDYQIYEIIFQKGEMNTNKMPELTNSVRVLAIYPYINPVYKDKLEYLKEYSFQTEVNIDKFTNYYIEQLNKNGYKQDAINAQIEGVEILKIRVYAKEEDLVTYRPRLIRT